MPLSFSPSPPLLYPFARPFPLPEKLRRLPIYTLSRLSRNLPNMTTKKTASPVRHSNPSASTSKKSFASLFSTTPKSSCTVSLPNGTTTDFSVYIINLCTTIKKPVAIAWLRHFGCTLCMRLARSWKDSRLLQETGATLVLVGCGSVEQLRKFVEESEWYESGNTERKLFAVTDPERETYGALGWERGWGSVLDARSAAKVVGSFWKGNRQRWSWIPTDPTQEGGVVLVDGSGDVQWIWKERFAGDHVKIETLVNHIREFEC